MGSDYYKLLGVTKDADDNEIKKAYKKMVCNIHLATFDLILTNL